MGHGLKSTNRRYVKKTSDKIKSLFVYVDFARLTYRARNIATVSRIGIQNAGEIIFRNDASDVRGELSYTVAFVEAPNPVAIFHHKLSNIVLIKSWVADEVVANLCDCIGKRNGKKALILLCYR